MELQKFIEQSLVQIAEGVTAANKALRKKDNDIQTSYLLTDGKDSQLKQQDSPTKISFDIAVTTSTNLKGDVEGSGSIFVVDAKLEGSVNKEKQNVSRVKFDVSVSKDLGYSRTE
ncbi:hypothetical protein EXU34_13285 [Alteromonas sp. ZYF713]|nr:hypothetical protein [Alteromonas sp. ZYF713]